MPVLWWYFKNSYVNILCLVVSRRQAFSDYQTQQMLSTFIDQFGFKEDEFSEQEERVEWVVSPPPTCPSLLPENCAAQPLNWTVEIRSAVFILFLCKLSCGYWFQCAIQPVLVNQLRHRQRLSGECFLPSSLDCVCLSNLHKLMLKISPCRLLFCMRRFLVDERAQQPAAVRAGVQRTRAAVRRQRQRWGFVGGKRNDV